MIYMLCSKEKVVLSFKRVTMNFIHCNPSFVYILCDLLALDALISYKVFAKWHDDNLKE